MKTFTLEDAREAFEEVFEREGEVTSLDVKNELRKRGFWATQSEVGTAVRDVAEELEYDWHFNGVYRKYYKVDIATPSSLLGGAMKNGVAFGHVSHTPPTKKRVPADPADRTPIMNPTSGDWIAFDVNDPNGPRYFKGKLTATQARYAFTLVENCDYADVRSRRF